MKKIGLFLGALLLGLSLTSCSDKTYTVTFNSNGGSKVSSQTVQSGELVTKPSDPTRTDYSFDGWYTDSALSDEWDFASDTVDSDLTLYAKWYDGYQVTVLDSDGNPISGIVVQWCNNSNCFGNPQEHVTDDLGIVRYPTLENDTYNVHFVKGVPTGYTYNPNIQTTEETKQITISLVPITEASGVGTEDNPYVVGAGNYVHDLESFESKNYYSFTPSEAGTYVIESHVMTLLNDKPLDLLYVGYSDKFQTQGDVVNDGGNGDNFQVTIEVSEEDVNKPIYFVIQSSRGSQVEQKFPNSYYFDIIKK